MNDVNKYDDIINLPHHNSDRHPRMSIGARSAQFAPFAALTGYGDAIVEASRLTDERIEIDDGLKQILNSKLQDIQCNLDNNLNITFTYFVPDMRKNGGAYISKTGIVKKIDVYNGFVILNDNTKIPINEIIDIIV